MTRCPVVLLAAVLACHDAVPVAPVPAPPAALRATLYATAFPLDEHPIREGGAWLNGQADALRWSDVRTEGGRAWGLQTGKQYRDATALLTGDWPAAQWAEAIVFIDHPGPPACHQEVELRLRSAMGAPAGIGSAFNRGYEVYWKTRTDAQSKVQIARWNGPFGSFQLLGRRTGAAVGLVSGDTIRAEAVGDTIRAYRNGVLQLAVVDSTFRAGGPGMGFNLNTTVVGCPGRNALYGVTRFAAGELTP